MLTQFLSVGADSVVSNIRDVCPHFRFRSSAKIVRMIVGEYEQRAIYKRYNVLGNGHHSVLETTGGISRVN